MDLPGVTDWVDPHTMSQWTPEQIAALERATKKPVVVNTDDREWCRAYIDHHCIYRSPPGELAITAQDGGVAAWQFYLPIAILNQEFACRIARLFWIADEPQWYGLDEMPFQLCGCESGGSLLVSVLQATAPKPVNAFMIKKAAKTYGLKNWLEGVVLPDVPVLLVDDVFGSGKTMGRQRERLIEFGLDVVGCFAIAECKPHPKLVEDVNFVSLYKPNDFARLHEEYVREYGKQPEFHGTVS